MTLVRNVNFIDLAPVRYPRVDWNVLINFTKGKLNWQYVTGKDILYLWGLRGIYCIMYLPKIAEQIGESCISKTEKNAESSAKSSGFENPLQTYPPRSERSGFTPEGFFECPMCHVLFQEAAITALFHIADLDSAFFGERVRESENISTNNRHWKLMCKNSVKK